MNSPLAPFWPWVDDFSNPTNRTMPVDRLRRPAPGPVRLRAGSVWVPLANGRLDRHDAQKEKEAQAGNEGNNDAQGNTKNKQNKTKT